MKVAEALLHIECLSDYLKREIIMSAASSEATEQLVQSAQEASGRKVVLRKESHSVRNIPSRKLPFEACCGVMMLREKSE